MQLKSIALLLSGIAVGVIVSNLPHAFASTTASISDLSQRRFRVSINEVKQNLVFFEEFTGRYAKVVTLSDGTTREIELTPMVDEGKQVVAFKDTDGLGYMSLNGTTTNGKLMVHVIDEDTTEEQLRAEGWTFGR